MRSPLTPEPPEANHVRRWSTMSPLWASPSAGPTKVYRTLGSAGSLTSRNSVRSVRNSVVETRRVPLRVAMCRSPKTAASGTASARTPGR